jgi:hypothetical protein
MRLLLALLLVTPLARLAASESIDSHVRAVFAELRALKSMKSDERYTLPAGGRPLTGDGDDFLRRRTANEIAASGLSCGCGDYALLFIERVKPRGFDALLIDSAAITLHSLVNKFDGHVVVAIRRSDAPTSPWWLVDSTALNVISRDWSPDSKSFTNSAGSTFWIGYCGPVEEYAVHSPAGLKKFYADTLAKVPAEFFNQHLVRFTFTIDKSLVGANGELLNPNVTRLERDQNDIFEAYGIKPAREIPILLVRGGDDASSYLDFVDGKWVSRVGLKSACSPSFLSWLDQKAHSLEQRSQR